MKFRILCLYIFFCYFINPLSAQERRPHSELIIGTLDLSTNRINTLHHFYSGLKGKGLCVSIKEESMDSADLDVRGRYKKTSASSSVTSNHANIMATILGGAGNTGPGAKGVARAVTLSSASFEVLLPEADTFYQNNQITVQNHSYGVGIENFYGFDARSYDLSIIKNPGLIHVFSSGNSGLSTSMDGRYKGIKGFANLTGSFKMAKNILTVGATDSTFKVESRSSRGPAYDGRIKPDLVAFGEDGSSGAAAMVSGTIILLQEHYKNLHQNSMPSAALIRSLLYSSAKDIQKPGPDYQSGFGSLDGKKAMDIITSGNHFQNSVSIGEEQTKTITLPAASENIRITLTWDDPAGTDGNIKALINDLDLKVVDAGNGKTYKPLILSTEPDSLLLAQAAVEGTDTLNNAEQVIIPTTSGDLRIYVTGSNIQEDQSYSLSWTYEDPNHFSWSFPTGSDALEAGAAFLLRWESGSSLTTGQLEYSTDKGNTWLQSAATVNLQQGWIQYTAPAHQGILLLRMKNNFNTYLSDSIRINTQPKVRVGYNCPDSTLIFWNRIPGITQYNVLIMGNTELQSFRKISDSSILVSNAEYSLPWYAVVPVIENKNGYASATINKTFQGVECYIKSFGGRLINSDAELELKMGSVYGVKEILFIKIDNNGQTVLSRQTPGTSLIYYFTDEGLSNGRHDYVAGVVLENGTTIYSDKIFLNFFKEGPYLVYPNPVRRGQPLQFASNDQIFTRVLVYDLMGRRMYEADISDVNTTIPTYHWPPGMYIMQCYSEGKLIFKTKLIVQ